MTNTQATTPELGELPRPPANLEPQVRAVSERLLAHMREIARQNGWALGVHGSMVRDLDVIAVPWTDEATSADAFVEAMRAAVARELSGRCFIQVIDGVRRAEEKPNGRRAYTLYALSDQLVQSAAGSHPFIDLSVLDFRLSRPVGDDVVERVANDLVSDISAAMQWAYVAGAEAVHENWSADAYPEFGEAASDGVTGSEALADLTARIAALSSIPVSTEPSVDAVERAAKAIALERFCRQNESIDRNTIRDIIPDYWDRHDARAALSALPTASEPDPFAWVDGLKWHELGHGAVLASVQLGGWLSATLDDPKVCDAMKADIREWFSAGEPMEILGQAATHFAEMVAPSATEASGEVVQADREAAADLYLAMEGEPHSPFDAAVSRSIRMGNNDHWEAVQAFRDHRLAHSGSDKYRLMLLDLLAVIHRDGGHKTQEIGIKLAWEQAMQRSSELLAHSGVGNVVASERVYLAKAVIELSENVTDRDGLSNHAEIAVDVAHRALALSTTEPVELQTEKGS